ncbi:MAG: type II/IV secretion system protein, partial [Verrucomicrobia bacterium]|nr:type II/IV secretion system protein [Verrucomicrobiota bacterium]
MGFTSIKSVFARASLATESQFDTWSKAWRATAHAGAAETMLAYMCRESGLTEEAFLQKLGGALDLPTCDLAHATIEPEARDKIATKVAFQHAVMPVKFENGVLTVATHNPFDTAMLNAVQFDARGPVQLALAPRAEIEKALKKHYGVGAETLEEIEDDEPVEIIVGDSKEITGDDQEASVIKFVNQIIWEAFKDRATDIHF